MLAVIAGVWGLWLGMILLMLSLGLQAALLGVRASIEGFPTEVTGLVMSGYAIGFLAGSSILPWTIRRVGGARVFAALASLASAAILIHLAFTHPIVWAAMRLITGFAYAGIFMVAEAWLNERSNEQTRRRILAIYVIIQHAAMACGPGLLNLADPEGFQLFILISVMISLALVPALFSAAPASKAQPLAPASVWSLYRVSPLGVFGCFGSGLSLGAFLWMGAVYAQEAQMTSVEVSLFLGAFLAGGLVLQWPLGKASVLLDRRSVIAAVSFLAAVVAFAALPTSFFSKLGFFAAIALLGGLSLPLYSLSVAHANDFLQSKQMPAVSGSLAMVMATGLIAGPLAAGFIMSPQVVGTNGFFLHLTVVHLLIGTFALYRMARRPAVGTGRQGATVGLYSTASTLATALAIKSGRRRKDADSATATPAQRGRG